MSEVIVEDGRRRFSLAASTPLETEQSTAIIELIRKPVQRARRDLTGRRTVTPGSVPGVGEVVVKHYTRGGFLGRCISHWYLRLGPVRSQIEFEQMQRARAIGVRVPEPVAFVWQGRFLYRAWLVVRAVHHHTTLAELSMLDPNRCEAIVDEVVQQIELLIKNGICHVDLHPGNVLVTETNETFIIDFDKAHQFSGPANSLRDRYLCRWRRAVIKHNLPEMLCERLCAGLRRNYSAFAPLTG